MFGIGGFELFIIILFAFLIFGPDKLPGLAKTLGSAIAKFRDAQEEVNSTIKDQFKEGEKAARAQASTKASSESSTAASATASTAVPRATAGADNTDKAASSPAAASESATSSMADMLSGKEDLASRRARNFAERKAAYDREREKRHKEREGANRSTNQSQAATQAAPVEKEA